MGLRNALPIFLCGLTSVPLAFALNAMQGMRNPLLILIVAVLSLSLVVLIPVLFKKSERPRHDIFYYVWSIFTFSSVIDLVIGLENDGIIPSAMAFYLQEGEPYLQTAYGTFISYWDGTGHLMMYIIILSADSYNQRYRTSVLYWVGSIGHSMSVFVPGNFVGKFGVKWGVFLNIPYLVIPIYAGYRMLCKKAEDAPSKQIISKVSIWKRPTDMFYMIYFLLATAVACFRACAVLGCKAEITQNYIKYYEPYLLDPVMYPKIQMLVYFFYFVPFYVCAINSIINCTGQSWLPDWSVIHAGAAIQAQVSHIGSSIHHMTEPSMRVPKTNEAQILFWIMNLSLLLIPQLFAYRCMSSNQSQQSGKGSPTKDRRSINNDDLSSSYNTRSKTRNRTKKDL